ncbi:MAG TPA: hypothetical protein VN380_26525 [Thermoanaerobaculia bacterium]|nr:hypothetical protein [Thermoanaerobaculia bacterium]
MKTTVTKWAMKAAGAGAIALLLATPSFAQSRWDGNRNNNDRGRQSTDARNGDNRQANNGYGDNRQANNGYRENQRVTMSGRVNSFSRERDGYRVQLDRGQSYWVPRSSFGNRDRDLRAGVSINLGGVFRGGSIAFDAVSYPGAVAGYVDGNGYVNGVIARIDYRDNTLVVRDQASGRLITAEMTADGRSNVRNLRPGDYVQMTGQWIGGGVFDVAQINRG